jgi:hypothetical protein
MTSLDVMSTGVRHALSCWMKGRVAGQLDADTLGTIDDPLETTDDGSAADLRQAEGEAEDSMPVVLLFFSTAAHMPRCGRRLCGNVCLQPQQWQVASGSWPLTVQVATHTNS